MFESCYYRSGITGVRQWALGLRLQADGDGRRGGSRTDIPGQVFADVCKSRQTVVRGDEILDHLACNEHPQVFRVDSRLIHELSVHDRTLPCSN
jgi:hypothetical protein